MEHNKVNTLFDGNIPMSAEQTFERYFANAVAGHIIRANHKFGKYSIPGQTRRPTQ